MARNCVSGGPPGKSVVRNTSRDESREQYSGQRHATNYGERLSIHVLCYTMNVQRRKHLNQMSSTLHTKVYKLQIRYSLIVKTSPFGE